MNNLYDPIKNIGISKVANACGVSDRAVYKWLKNGFLPKQNFLVKRIMPKRYKQYPMENTKQKIYLI